MTTSSDVDELKCSRDEQRRIGALYHYDILDSPPETVFDRITRLVCQTLDVPMSTMTFVDGHRQWFKSRQGLHSPETVKEPSFCNQALKRRDLLVIFDARDNPELRVNPFVCGPPFIRFYAGVPFFNPEGEPIGTLCALDTQPRQFGSAQLAILSELAGLASETLELRKQAMVDALTGVATRRAITDAGNRAWALAQRYNQAFSVLVFDIDFFKRINDTYGHATGDAVLAGAVNACRRSIRSSDIIGRIGGEEFAVIMPNTNSDGACALSEKIRSAIEAEAYCLLRDDVKVTVSVGYAAARRTDETFEMLLCAADEALYAAKRAGRNCVREAAPDSATATLEERKMLRAGEIFPISGLAIKCTVRRLTREFADLQVCDQSSVPDHFALKIGADGFSENCFVIARQPGRVQVALKNFGRPRRVHV